MSHLIVKDSNHKSLRITVTISNQIQAKEKPIKIPGVIQCVEAVNQDMIAFAVKSYRYLTIYNRKNKNFIYTVRHKGKKGYFHYLK